MIRLSTSTAGIASHILGAITGKRPTSTANVTSNALNLLGMPLASMTVIELLQHIETQLSQKRGGWVVTANLDILRHFLSNEKAREAYLAADLRVADGMPLVWASHLKGCPLPERVAGSSVCEPLLEMCARRGFRAVLLGGAEGTAERVAESFSSRSPGFEVRGNSRLRFSSNPSDDELEAAQRVLADGGCDLVLVGLGSPKQELVIERLRERWPAAWFMGVGGSFNFLTGDVRRAPYVVQELGLEWVHRLLKDPRRLGPRYLRDDLPVGARLLADSMRARLKLWRQ